MRTYAERLGKYYLAPSVVQVFFYRTTVQYSNTAVATCRRGVVVSRAMSSSIFIYMVYACFVYYYNSMLAFRQNILV